MRRPLAVPVVLLLACTLMQTAAAQAPTPARTSCIDAASRAFDFWIGEWTVFDPRGKEVGRNRIELVAGRCALQEHWTGNGNVIGTSLSFPDAQDQKWHQVWIDNSGSSLFLTGMPTASGMTLEGVAPSTSTPGRSDRQRVAWARRDDGSVRQLWETSGDDGKTWTTAFDGIYVKTKG